LSKTVPEELLQWIAEGINTENLDSLMMQYEADAYFAFQPGHFVTGRESIRQSLQSFIDMKGKLESNVKRLLQTSNLALVISKWSSFTGTGPDDKPVKLAAAATDLLRQQPNGTWRVLIHNPWGTD
jgi:ketosteroid isomerase-like protein